MGSQTSLKTSQKGGCNGIQTVAIMVSKISRICPRFKETLGVRRTRKLGNLDLDAGTSFVPTGKLPGSSGENITREGRGVSPSEEQIADCISAVTEESIISLLTEEHVFETAEVEDMRPGEILSGVNLLPMNIPLLLIKRQSP